MSKEQDKNAKALALLTKNKEAGRLSIDDPEAMMQKLTERYGDKAYDLVVNALVKPKTVMDDLGQTGVKPSSANTLNYLISDEISKENIAKLGGQVAYGEDYQGARKDAQEKCQIASETIAQAKDDWANYIQSIIEPHISPAQRAETVIVAKEDNLNANAAIEKTQEEIASYKTWQEIMDAIPTFTPQFFKEQEEVTIPLRPKEETKDRDTLNAEYADQIGNPNNWKEVKVEEAVQMPQEKDIGVMYAAPEMPSTGGYTPEYDAAIRGKDTKETVVEMQMAPEMPTTGGYTPEYDAAIRGKETKETVVEMQMAPEMPTTGGYTPEYDAAIKGKDNKEQVVEMQMAPEMPTTGGYTPEYDAAIKGKDNKEQVVETQSAPMKLDPKYILDYGALGLDPSSTNIEKIGNNTVSISNNGITSVDDKGNGYGATINDKGTLDYFVIRNGEKEPITAKNRGPLRENRAKEIGKLNEIAIALAPESELSKAAIKNGKPYSLEVIQKDVRIITVPYNEGTVKEEAKASVERMKKAKESNTQGMSLRARVDAMKQK